MRIIPTLLLTFLATPALANTCKVRINATDFEVNADLYTDGTATRRERLLNWPTRNISKLRGNLPNCASDVTLNFLAGLEGLKDSDGYCLTDGDEAGLLLVPGAQNYRGRCTISTCERVNGTADDVQSLVSQVSNFAYGSAPDDSKATAHASGSLLLTASRFTLQRSIEGGASTLVAAALATPAATAATAVTLVTVGGGVWLCSE